jgi:tRNA (guanine-N7-)-methyltransferase
MAHRGRRTSPPEGERPRFRPPAADDLRHPEANPYLDAHREWSPEVVPADVAHTFHGRWEAAFGRSAPLHVEIGSGNGFFLAGTCAAHPEWNVLGVEIRYKRAVLCARKLRAAGLTNGRIARYDAFYLDDLFTDGAAAALYVNHPDPWPRERHAKNRLISRWFLEEAARILQSGAPLRLKSDYLPNIERLTFHLDHDDDGEPAPRLPFDVTGRADDVTTGPAPWPDDIETNYQSKFRKRGLPVYAVALART